MRCRGGGIIGRNPAKRGELPRIEEPPRRFLTTGQTARLADAMPDRQYRVMVFVLAYGGLRFGEMAALRRRRVDVLGRKLEIVESAAEVKGGMVFGATKTHTTRKASHPAFVAEMVADHLGDIPPKRPRSCSPRHRAVPSGTLAPAMCGIGARAVAGPDLADITPHDLRHTCASLMRPWAPTPRRFSSGSVTLPRRHSEHLHVPL